MKKYSFYLLLLIAIVYFFYTPILDGFFQQDEWLTFGNLFIESSKSTQEVISKFFSPTVGHYTPLSRVSLFFLLSKFQLNYLNWAILSLLLHLLATVLVYIILTKLFKNNLSGFLVALLFGLGASGFQATTWPVADINTHGATIFGLLAILFTMLFIEGKKKVLLIASILCLTISLLFKEITVGLFLVLPLFIYLFSEKKNKRKQLTYLILLSGVFYVLVRVIFLFLPNVSTTASLVTQSQSPPVLIYNFLTLPFKSVTQVIVPIEILVSGSHKIATFFPETITGEINTTSFDGFAEKKVLEGISLILGLLIVGFSIYFYKKVKNLSSKFLIFSTFFVVFNSLIFSFAPEKSGVVTIVDSRNLYLLSFGGALIVYCLVTVLSERISANKNIIKRVKLFSDGRFIFTSIMIIAILINTFYLSTQIKKINTQSIERSYILDLIKDKYPKLPEKAIFFVVSDTSYYGLPTEDKILPFQSGFGQTIMVWYYPTERFETSFFDKRFLWEITSQGYREVNGRGIGYFRNLELLKKALSENNLSADSVIAFKWASDSETLTDISDLVKERLGRNEINEIF